MSKSNLKITRFYTTAQEMIAVQKAVMRRRTACRNDLTAFAPLL